MTTHLVPPIRPSTMLRILVVDDDPVRRGGLVARLRAHAPADVVDGVAWPPDAEDGDGEEADLVLLAASENADAWEAAVRALSQVSFVVPLVPGNGSVERAYGAGAFDVLTPGVDRLEEVVLRSRNALRAVGGRAQAPDRPGTLANTIQGGDGHITKFIARSGSRIYFVDVDDVLWIRAAGNYVELHGVVGHHLVRATLSSLDPRLDPARFRRIHRSTIVNLDAVAEVQSDGHGQYIVQLRNGTTLQLTRTFRGNLLSGRAG